MNKTIRISNITSDQILYTYTDKDDNEHIIHQLQCDVTYEDGQSYTQVDRLVNHNEYLEIQQYGCYHPTKLPKEQIIVGYKMSDASPIEGYLIDTGIYKFIIPYQQIKDHLTGNQKNSLTITLERILDRGF
jgi:hypothetical protein